MTAVLVDDEENSRKVLSGLLRRFCLEVEICGEAEDAETAYDLVTKVFPDIVFLDIHMPSSSGFNLLRRFRELPFEVIFVTGFDQYAIHAIKFSALDYLLKPVEASDLVAAVQRAARKLLAPENSKPQVINFLYNIEGERERKTIMVHVRENVVVIPVVSICVIEADNRYCFVQIITGEQYTITRTLKEFEEFLAGDPAFLRISRDVIIHTTFIRSYSKGEHCVIEMQNNRIFEISRRKKTRRVSLPATRAVLSFSG